MKKVLIYSDGACSGNPGPGGWAAVLFYGAQVKEISGGTAATTNNRMELQAAIQGLAALREACLIEFFTDSEYLRKGILDGVPIWKRNGWKTRDKSPVKNKDQWQQLEELTKIHQISWQWLKGHAGHPENERCDLLARREIEKLLKQYTSAQLKNLLDEFKTSGQNHQGQSLAPLLFQEHQHGTFRV
ncbi:MAG: ribonuclease [Verrucomicrobiales bacterium]|nr:ribonuclease [Verrucomicrobiales bacterium]